MTVETQPLARPDAQMLPTHAQLFKATLVAMAVAAVVLLIAVLPAEYGIDPTGIGTRLGLTAIAKGGHGKPAPPAKGDPAAGAAKPASLSTRDAAAAAADAAATVVRRDVPFRSDEMSVTLQPGKGAEIKAKMEAGDRFVFSWQTDGGKVNFDMHGEAPNSGGAFTSYWEDKFYTSGHGSFVAPFAGAHGWFWANVGPRPVTVTVKTSGFYEKLYRP